MRGEHGRNARGFTLVELLVAQALGLAMMTVLVASLSSLYKRVQVSADAAENSETAYFLMGALAHWLSESRSPMLAVDSLSTPTWTADDDESTVIVDPCGTPLKSPFDFYHAAAAIVPAEDVSCLPSPSVTDSSMVLVVERRLPCREKCGDAGFYAVLPDCSSGHVVPEWRSGDRASGDEASGVDEASGGEEARGKKNSGGMVLDDMGDGGSDDETCDAEPLLFQLHRMLIYVRNYSRRRGDGVPALMMSRLATEPEPRWLRSDMLASGVFDWDLRERMGTHRSRAVTVRFSVKGKHQSTSVDRTILLELSPLELPRLELRPSVFRPVDRRPDARLALDLAWP